MGEEIKVDTYGVLVEVWETHMQRWHTYNQGMISVRKGDILKVTRRGNQMEKGIIYLALNSAEEETISQAQVIEYKFHKLLCVKIKAEL